MTYSDIVSPSNLVSSTLPGYIAEQYERFVEFIETAQESEERHGFSQDILQNLQKYRDFNHYNKPVVEYNYLDTTRNRTSNLMDKDTPSREGISDIPIISNSNQKIKAEVRDILAAVDTDKLVLFDGRGFPDENGVLMIGEEVILYRRRIGNFFYDLKRGASATTVLGTFLHESVYNTTEAADHFFNDKVYNISGLFELALLDTIHKTFTVGIERDRVSPKINRGTVLENIRDFFQSKGTKLGIKALFKILFSENDVRVYYPGDQMIIPSKSTWYESQLVRVVPFTDTLSDLLDEVEKPYATPDKLIGQELVYKSFNDEGILGKILCDYASAYPHNDETQYEIYVEKDNVNGDIIANPRSPLTRDLLPIGAAYNDRDVFTVTVETTLGFPPKGHIVINNEVIEYTNKSMNQFFGCTRGKIGVAVKHFAGDYVFGPYYFEATATDREGVEYISRSWPLGLVKSVDVVDPGVLHTEQDLVVPSLPGRIDPRDPIMESFNENYTDVLATQQYIMPQMAYIGDHTSGVSSIFFDDDYAYAASAGFPDYSIGPFSKEFSIGPQMRGRNFLHVIPRRNKITTNTFIQRKGTNAIGTFIDGVAAYSNVSPQRVTQGSVCHYIVENGGNNYNDPVLLLNGIPTDEVITIENGSVISISNNSNKTYLSDVEVRISSGEGAKLAFEFDPFGRVTEVYVIDGGMYYNDAPIVTAVDESNRGKGAVFAAEVEGGVITKVNIVHHGIDYAPDTTNALVSPIGDGAEVYAEIQFFQFDRHYEIENREKFWHYDSGGGFLFEGTTNDRSDFAYIRYPDVLAKESGDNGGQHSPLLGWAFDGNPIYGPIGYANKKDDSDGLAQYWSGYVLRETREGMLASGGDDDTIAALPPDEVQYPLGTFVEDYEWDPDAVRFKLLLDAQKPVEEYKRLMTQDLYNIAVLRRPDRNFVLDKCNSAITNTPEFPAELYPDGVRCYFVTLDGTGEPAFPYIIGKTFCDLPVSQNLTYYGYEKPTFVSFGDYDPRQTYDDTPLTFDYNVALRYRHPYLASTKEELELEVSNTTQGSISEVYVQDGAPETSKVGDFCYFDNTDTMGGGAEAKVSHVWGEEVTSAVGSDITTITLTHLIQLNLQSNEDTFTFVEGTVVQFGPSGAKGFVVSYDYINKLLVVRVYTKQLMDYGDVFYDNRGALVTIPTLDELELGQYDIEELNLITEGYNPIPLETANELSVKLEDGTVERIQPSQKEIVGNYTYIGNYEPVENLKGGDLWFSPVTGRLYVYYDDNDSRQWVCTQPLGTRPMSGALNVPIGNQETPTAPNLNIKQEDGIVTISHYAPSERMDNTPLQLGDMWWSPHNGVMSMWFENEWVAADPNGRVSRPWSNHRHQWDGVREIDRMRFESQQYVIISQKAPHVHLDGTPIVEGTLWWSSMTAKMYVRYTDEFGVSQWVVTNPLGMLSHSTSLDDLVTDGGGNTKPPPILPLPEPPPGEDGAVDMSKGRGWWFEQLTHFHIKDEMLLISGAPGSEPGGGAAELAQLDEIIEPGKPCCAKLQRGENPIALPDRTPVYNRTRSLYTVTTAEPHLLRKGDTVKIENSIHDEVNNTHTIVDAGVVEPAEGYTVVNAGVVTDVVITNPGAYYKGNFYISFYGNGGVGGYAYVRVNSLAEGGNVVDVEIRNGGVQYQRPPYIVWGDDELSNTEFTIYTSETLSEDNDIIYSTTSDAPTNSIAYVAVTGTGIGYAKLPPIRGIYKRAIDRAETFVDRNGTQIGSVDVIYGGSRYNNPVVIFDDITGAGHGAEAEAIVENGQVTKIIVTDPGHDYVEPMVTLVEADGKFIPQTEDIGKITSFKVLNPGRQISVDRSLNPEIWVTTRAVLIDIEGDIVTTSTFYQGIESLQWCWGTIVEYDEDLQMVTFDYISGQIRHGEKIYFSNGASATVMIEGQGDYRVMVKGISSPLGDFLDDTSKVSESYPVIQDSRKYQWFSYSIASPLQSIEYDTFVKSIIHPAGFELFPDVVIYDETSTQLNVTDVRLPNLNR